MANVRNKPAENGKYQGWYKNYRGKRIFFTGTTKKVETRRIAEDHEHHHAMIRLGQVPPPSKATRAGKRQFSEVTHEYLDWGNSQGVETEDHGAERTPRSERTSLPGGNSA